MTARRTFTQAEFNAVIAAQKAGVRVALVAYPDGRKVLMGAGELDAPAASNDLDTRIDAYGGM